MFATADAPLRARAVCEAMDVEIAPHNVNDVRLKLKWLVERLAEFWPLNQIVARTGLPGLKWYAADGAVSGQTMAICLLGCPAPAWFVGLASARAADGDDGLRSWVCVW